MFVGQPLGREDRRGIGRLEQPLAAAQRRRGDRRCSHGVRPPDRHRSASHPLEDPGRAHAAADAHRDHAVAAAAALQLVEQRRRQLGAGAASGWPSAMAPPLTFSRSGSIGSSLQAGEHLRGERLVQLDEIDLVERQAGQLQRLADRRHRADAEALGLDAGRREGDEARRAASGRAPARSAADVTTTAAAPSLVCDELPAVTVPVAWNAGRSFAERLGRRVAPRPFVDGERHARSTVGRVAVRRRRRCRAVTGTISSANRPASMAAIAR